MPQPGRNFLTYTLCGIVLTFILLLFGCSRSGKIHRLGILQWTEDIEAFNQSYRGLIKGLKAMGYTEGQNLRLIYRNADQDQKEALRIVREFIRNRVDLIVTLGTGSTLAALQATSQRPIPIVYSNVGDPVGTGILKAESTPGSHITGVSMKIAMQRQFQMLQQALPSIQKLGVLYCTQMPQAVSTGKEAVIVGRNMGWDMIEQVISPEELDQLAERAHQLASQVDAIYLPTDPILYESPYLQTILGQSDAAGIPVIAVSPDAVRAGAFMAIHCSFQGIGRQAALLISSILDGIRIQDLAPQGPAQTFLTLNLRKARALGLVLPRNIILKADAIVD